MSTVGKRVYIKTYKQAGRLAPVYKTLICFINKTQGNIYSWPFPLFGSHGGRR